MSNEQQTPQNRQPRDQETRAQQQRYAYTPANALPEPKQDPSFAYRWIATHTMGQLDPVTSSLRFRDGWEPVKAADHPELHVPGNAKGNVELGGLMLCRMPKEKALARKRYYEAQTQAQETSIDNTLFNQRDPRSNMKLFAERESEVLRGAGFGKGSQRQ